MAAIPNWRSLLITAIPILFLVFGGCLYSRGQKFRDLSIPTPLQKEETLVLGILGGRDSWKDPRPGVARLGQKLLGRHIPGLRVQIIENKKRKLAVQLVKRAFDGDQDGNLDYEERRRARLILYGQSFGGAAVVKLANDLNFLGVPVLLTVQMDSVGVGDRIIPPNVRKAANLFQRNGFIRGEPEIVADNPERTKIIGNFEFDYSNKQIDLAGVRFFKKILRVAHTKMDRDPDVWVKIESLILGEIR